MSITVARIKSLACWQGPVDVTSLDGGITNENYLVTDGDRKYVVRIGDDIPLHHVMRFNELAASNAAHAAGLSPKVIHHVKGILVLEFIEGKSFSETDVQDQKNLQKILPLLKSCHNDIPNHLRGPVLSFHVFHILRDYSATIKAGNGRRMMDVPRLMNEARHLEAAVGPIDLVFGHNDLLASNIMDDGNRLWLIDWDYAGFNSPLFDLGGLASNNNLSQQQEIWLLENYFEQALSQQLWCRYHAMKCASLLRETMWSMVSELHSDIEFDYANYTDDNLSAFDAALEDLQNL